MQRSETERLGAGGRAADRRPGREWLIGLSSLLVAALVGALVWLRLGPPAVVPSSAAPELFSAERARKHVEQIARVPHPSGSPAARLVEAYLVRELGALGLEVEVQAAPACVEIAGLRRCGHVRNVLARSRGSAGEDPEGTLMLSAHYDSVPNAPGAGDDAAAVAALLEAARALKQAGPLGRDVWFAFLDGEEDLLLGSAAFCADPERRRRVRLVANFDARGSRGAVTLISATPGSAAVVDRLARDVKHPVLSSFYPSVARVLPNATDAEMYARCGLEAVSFAFAGGFEHYHQSSDGPAQLDYRSLQHHGEYALAVARRFAQGAAEEAVAGELVFFDVGALLVVVYPAWVARLLALLLAVATGWLLLRRKREGRLRPGPVALAAVLYCVLLPLASLLGAAVLAAVTAGWRPWAAYVHASTLAACAACFVAAAYVAAAARLRRGAYAEGLRLGPLVVWVALAVLTAVAVPGMSQLFTWPAAALLATLAWRERSGVSAELARGLLLLPPVLLITPVIYTLVVVVGAPGASAAMIAVVLLLGAFAIPVELLGTRARGVCVALVAAGVLLAGALRVSVAADPGPASGYTINYALDSQAQRALWASTDGAEDAFTRQFLGDLPERGRFESFRSDQPLSVAPAPLLDLPAPALDVLSDTWLGGERRIILRVRSRRAARSLSLWETNGVAFSTYALDGSQPVQLIRFDPELDRKLYRLLSGTEDDGRFGLELFATPAQGSLLTLTTQHAGPLELRLSDCSKGLALTPAGFAPRSADSREGYPGDHTWVSAAPLAIGELPRPTS